MLRSLAIKELRETYLIALAALAVYAHFLATAMRFQTLPFSSGDYGAIPFIGDSFSSAFTMVSAGLAVALGLRQSAWESVHNTYLFLLHRPAPRWQLLGVKLAVGLALYLAAAAAPVWLYAWWAATPGTHASPFEWSMTFPTWQIWCEMTAIYLAAFLCGIRPAHWLWSRLWPLIAAGMLVLAIHFLPLWPILGLAALVLLNVILVTTILFLARNRDY